LAAAGVVGVKTLTPLFQINFLLLFIHVYFFPAKVDVSPTFLQLAPAFTAAFALIGEARARIRIKESAIFFIGKVLGVVEDYATI
jgi:hypothetical protein